MVANPARGQLSKFFLSHPRSRLRIWSHETGSAVPSRVSLLIFHTQAESGAYSQDSSCFPRRRPLFDTANRHRASPEFIRSRNCVSRWRSVPRVRRHRASSPRDSSSNGCYLFRFQHGSINVHLSFLTPTITIVIGM